jgi:hypothetical protein
MNRDPHVKVEYGRVSPSEDDYGRDEEYDDDNRNKRRRTTASQEKIDVSEERIKKNFYDTEAWTVCFLLLFLSLV